MAIVYEGERATFANSGSDNEIVIPLASGASQGNHLIGVSFINSTPTITGITDTQGNTWQVDVEVTSGSSFTTAIFSAHLATALTTSDAVTIAFSGAAGPRLATLEEFSGLETTGWLDQVAEDVAASGTAVDSGSTPTTSQADELIVGGFGAGGGDTSFTKGTGFSAFTTTELFSTRNLFQEYRIVSATGAYNADGTLGATARWSAMCATYKAAAAAPSGNAGNMLLLGCS